LGGIKQEGGRDEHLKGGSRKIRVQGEGLGEGEKEGYRNSRDGTGNTGGKVKVFQRGFSDTSSKGPAMGGHQGYGGAKRDGGKNSQPCPRDIYKKHNYKQREKEREKKVGKKPLNQQVHQIRSLYQKRVKIETENLRSAPKTPKIHIINGKKKGKAERERIQQ